MWFLVTLIVISIIAWGYFGDDEPPQTPTYGAFM